jgi:hypothetical protein
VENNHRTSIPGARPLSTSCQRPLFLVLLHLGDQHLQRVEITWVPTRPDEIEGSVKIIFIYVAHHRHLLIADLFICPEDNKEKPAAYQSVAMISELIESMCLVYEVPTFEVCQRWASSSLQNLRIDAATVRAAESPPVKARWTPDEKNGSMNA